MMHKRILTAVAASFLSATVFAAASLSNGSVVRIQASSIEEGWHSGRMHLDAQKCWMVKLDKPTRDHYTMLALTAVDQLQLSSDGIWSPIGLKPVLQRQPEVCREYAND